MTRIVLSALFSFFFLFQANAQSNQFLHFDGVDDYVVIDSAAKFITGNQMSMTGWFYCDKLKYGSGLMGFRGGGTGQGVFYLLILNNGKLEARLGTSATYDVPNNDGTMKEKVWQHIAMTYNGSVLKLYVDGVEIGNKAASGFITSTDKPFAIGKSLSSGSNFVYNGRVDEVTLWSKELSQSEIQNMMTDGLTGTEPKLELYYKCDQGFPYGDNTSITKLVSEVGDGERDAIITNLAMNGDSSNFGGDLDTKIQAISFPQISDQATTTRGLLPKAKSTSGLKVYYNIESGPATISGDSIILDGTAGFVTVSANQDGNSSFDPAKAVISTFEALDPSAVVPNIDIRNPIEGDFYATELNPIELAAVVDIDHADLFSVKSVKFEIDGISIKYKDWKNKHYTSLWTPNDFGSHTFTVTATNNFGETASKTTTFNITKNYSDENVTAFKNVWLKSDIGSEEVEGVLPSYVGAFDSIGVTLEITCPTGGCDPWDRVSSVEAQGHNGEWYEVIRYLTPYGIACSHSIDLTDFMTLFQGKVRFRPKLGTYGNGFLYTLKFNFHKGTPEYNYGYIDKLWGETYQFGDYGNLQPCETYNIAFDSKTKEAKIKLVSTGHGWDPAYNTGNAAEFHRDTHAIYVNDARTFEQDNWMMCSPNPDACNNQLGTYLYDRAGWCPGSIAPWFDYDMTDQISPSKVKLEYKFNPNYVDLCHPNHPDCKTGVTCANCDQGFNPHLIVKSYLLSYSNEPYNKDTTASYKPDTPTTPSSIIENPKIQVAIGPNPSGGMIYVDYDALMIDYNIDVFDILGKNIWSLHDVKKSHQSIDLRGIERGIYIVNISPRNGEVKSHKVVIE